MSDDQSYRGFTSLFSGGDEFNQMDAVVRSILNRIGTTLPVQVKKVTAAGEVDQVGFVDIQPMVKMIDGRGQTTSHGVIHNVPYFRLQGGANAVIIDPVVGDIGIALFASRDISAVKNNRAEAQPGSWRTFSFSDAIYLGGILNGAPEQYIRFKSDGDIEIKPAAKVYVLGNLEVQGDTKVTGSVDVDGDAHAAGTITGDTDVIGNGKSLSTHIHSGVTTGGGNSGPPV